MGETAAEQPPPAQQPSERYAELIVERVRKDDGRALILYSHARPGEGQSGDERRAAPQLDAPSVEQA
jgi:hypothetical protein